MDTTAQDLLIIVLATAVLSVTTAVVVWFTIKSSSTKLVPAALLLIGFCLEIYFIKQPFIQIGLQIYPQDAISLFVLLATLVELAYYEKIKDDNGENSATARSAYVSLMNAKGAISTIPFSV